MRRIALAGALLLTGLVIVDPTPAAALVRYVASHGADTATCGTVTAPCRSISRAIARAVAGDRIMVGPGLYGDIDHDGLFITPGDEGADPGCGCAVSVTKAVTIESTAGAGATVIEHPVTAVRVSAPGSVVGGRDRGFTLRADNVAVIVAASDVTVRDHRITGAADGISVLSTAGAVTIAGNFVTGIRTFGARIAGDGAVVSGNVFEGNGVGVLALGAGTVISDNHVVNSGGPGIAVSGDDTTVRRNVLVGNRGPGVLVEPVSGPTVARTIVTSNNLAHNGSVPDRLLGGNCGISSVRSAVNAERNFWGSAQGPGADPADGICMFDATIDTVPILTRPVAITNLTAR